MPNRKTPGTSAVPGKPKVSDDDAPNVRRQEGTVNEHRERLNRNNRQETDADQEPRRHREPGRRR